MANTEQQQAADWLQIEQGQSLMNYKVLREVNEAQADWYRGRASFWRLAGLASLVASVAALVAVVR